MIILSLFGIKMGSLWSFCRLSSSSSAASVDSLDSSSSSSTSQDSPVQRFQYSQYPQQSTHWSYDNSSGSYQVYTRSAPCPNGCQLDRDPLAVDLRLQDNYLYALGAIQYPRCRCRLTLPPYRAPSMPENIASIDSAIPLLHNPVHYVMHTARYRTLTECKLAAKLMYFMQSHQPIPWNQLRHQTVAAIIEVLWDLHITPLTHNIKVLLHRGAPIEEYQRMLFTNIPAHIHPLYTRIIENARTVVELRNASSLFYATHSGSCLYTVLTTKIFDYVGFDYSTDKKIQCLEHLIKTERENYRSTRNSRDEYLRMLERHMDDDADAYALTTDVVLADIENTIAQYNKMLHDVQTKGF